MTTVQSTYLDIRYSDSTSERLQFASVDQADAYRSQTTFWAMRDAARPDSGVRRVVAIDSLTF